MKNTLVSVIIPFYNRPIKTIRAIKSVLNQTYQNFEIILVDDGSNESLQILKDFCNKKKIKIFTKKNAGPASARNFGIRQAKGEYIAFLDSDDLWLPNKLKVQLSFMLKKNILFSHTSYQIINFSNCIKNIKIVPAKAYKFPNVIFHNRIATPTVMFKKCLLINENISFIEKYRRGEDTVLWAIISKKTKLHNIDKNLVRVYQNSKTSALNTKNKIEGFFAINDSLSKNKFLKFIHLMYIYIRILFNSL
tara:strand:- start:80 stop:826 length:747 start_codon:yes stop_codon:yes gene_type:complete